ncbi:WD40 repeat-like protein [Tilletiaria anomala UBC 951]|uniref:Pre-rRNA-processing protein IPI3 n=1 Tax=Tilletiaria anomala (strain ATCC 24038 / CBS 436.72 / UBC 951) TaxID=1037660 RepID=A0A066VFA3_TILAU|nr:WD40 repeat-like protein [Tilletiaria anomala UBC 951]KDN40156.1 WD40 repeat-like protein [Tilletiaria anomala UBC 951]
MASSSSSAFTASGCPAAREAILVSTTSTPAQPSSLLLLDVQLPNMTNPLISFRLQQPHSIGQEKLDFVPTAAGAAALHNATGSGGGNSAGDAGGYVVTQAENSSVLTTHNFQSPQLLARIILPQRMTCLQLNARFHLLAAGLSDGRISVWDIKTGELIANGFDAHYRPVSVLRWTSDGSALLSGGEDGRICVWTLAAILDPLQSHSSSSSSVGTGAYSARSNTQPIPYALFTDHTLSITSLCLSTGTFPSEATLWSASLDGSVKHWSLRTRTLLSTFILPRPVAQLQLDASNRFFLASTVPPHATSTQAGDGADHSKASTIGSNTLFKVDLFRRAKVSSAAATGKAGWGSTKGKTSNRTGVANTSTALAFEARGGHAPSEVERISAENGMDKRTDEAGSISRLPFSEAITSLCLSLSSTVALVGTASARIHFVDLSSFQILRSISLLATLSSSSNTSVAAAGQSSSRAASPVISNIRSMLTPPDLLSSLTGSSSFASTNGSGAPSSIISPLQQSVEASLRAANRTRRYIPAPILASQFDRITRRAAAEQQRPQQQSQAKQFSSADTGACQGGALAPAASGGTRPATTAASGPNPTRVAHVYAGRPVRLVANVSEAQGEQDLLTRFISPSFFEGLLKPLGPADAYASPSPSPALSTGQTLAFAHNGPAVEDMISLDQPDATLQSKKRKGGADETNEERPTRSDAHKPGIDPSHGRCHAGDHVLRAENAELKSLVAQAKALNDEMWKKLQELEQVNGARDQAGDVQMSNVQR